MFSERFKQLRKKFNMTQSDVADALYTSTQTISRWETGDCTPDLNMLIPISKLFNITIDYLLENDKIDITNLGNYIFDTIKKADDNEKFNLCFKLCQDMNDGFFGEHNTSMKTYSEIYNENGIFSLSNRNDCIPLVFMLNRTNIDMKRFITEDKRYCDFFSDLSDFTVFKSVLKLFSFDDDYGYDKEGLRNKLGVIEEDFDKVILSLRKLKLLYVKNIEIVDKEVILYFPIRNWRLMQIIALCQQYLFSKSDGQIYNVSLKLL